MVVPGSQDAKVSQWPVAQVGRVVSVLYGGGRVSEQDLEQCAAAGSTQRHVLDALTIVALKTLSNAVNRIAHTPLDPQFSEQAWRSESAV
jgi:hypothetical protein